MRLRNIPAAPEAVANSAYCISEPDTLKGQWKMSFSNNMPLHIEIGMGKGQFLMQLAKLHPDIYYLGMERYASILYRGLQKMEEDPLSNLSFLPFDATNITDYFAPFELDKIYLNFSDPWPKDRHANRRLTSPIFLQRYHNIITTDGSLEFKTDHRDLFDFSVKSFEESSLWELDLCTYDLHHDPLLSQGNIMTEYEAKFSSMGNSICKLTAHPVF